METDHASEPTPERRPLAWLVVAVVAIAALTWFLSRPAETPTSSASVPAEVGDEPTRAAVGAQAPFDFTLKNLEGADVQLTSFKGKVVLINFWATWCGPCKAEIPDLAMLQREHGDSLAVVGIVVLDSFGEKVRTMSTELGVNYPVLDGNDNADLEEAYGPMWGLPTSVIIGRDGRVAKRQTGAATKQQFDAMIRPLL